MRGIHRWLVSSLHKGPVMRKMFPFEDVIMWWDAIQLLQTQVTNNHFIDWNTFEKYPLYSAHILIVEVRLYFRVVKQYITTNFLMTSSNENIFCITGPLCGELTGHQWIPLMKASHKSIFLDWLISLWTKWQPFNTFNCIFMNENLFLRVQLTTSQHWFM